MVKNIISILVKEGIVSPFKPVRMSGLDDFFGFKLETNQAQLEKFINYLCNLCVMVDCVCVCVWVGGGGGGGGGGGIYRMAKVDMLLVVYTCLTYLPFPVPHPFLVTKACHPWQNTQPLPCYLVSPMPERTLSSELQVQLQETADFV